MWARLQHELREAIHAGAALAALGLVAGCGGETPEAWPSEAAAGGAGLADGASGENAATQSDVSQSQELPLEPLPVESLGCYGPVRTPAPGLPGFHGQCCFKQYCVERADGDCTGGLRSGDYRPFGCPCSETESPWAGAANGPFAPNPAAPSNGKSCCYAVGEIACDGRPFVVTGDWRLAHVVQRTDWGLA